MALSAFADKSHTPEDAEVAARLGDTHPLWTELQRTVATRFAPVAITWGFSGPSTGWGLRLKKGDRAILYMTPCDGYFLASFALGEKAVAAAHASGLPDTVLQVIDTARRYAEGRGVRLPVRSAEDLRAVEELVAIKVAR